MHEMLVEQVWKLFWSYSYMMLSDIAEENVLMIV